MTADTMQNAKILEDKMPQEQNAIISAIYTIADVIVFIVVAIGYIIQDSFYLIFGYPEKDLLNKTALVTGGGSGIGRRLAQRLTDMGAKVVIWDINQAGIKETIQIVESMGGYCKGYVVDISDKNQVYKAAELVRREVGDIDILINNAGVVSGRLLLDTPDYLIERSFNVNVLAHFWTTKAFLPRMIERDEGHIVTIASMAGHVGICKLVDYCASKFAAVGFDEALRMELDVLGHQGVKTTCICPYFIQSTGMFDDVNARWISILDPNDVAERIIKAIKINEAIVIIPGYIKLLLSLRWLFPWGCASGLLKRLVPDAAPHQPPVAIPTETINNIKSKAEIIATMTSEDDDMPKSASLLVKRSPSHGERVL